jgi:hypothetical protein
MSLRGAQRRSNLGHADARKIWSFPERGCFVTAYLAMTTYWPCRAISDSGYPQTRTSDQIHRVRRALPAKASRFWRVRLPQDRCRASPTQRPCAAPAQDRPPFPVRLRKLLILWIARSISACLRCASRTVRAIARAAGDHNGLTPLHVVEELGKMGFRLGRLDFPHGWKAPLINRLIRLVSLIAHCRLKSVVAPSAPTAPNEAHHVPVG